MIIWGNKIPFWPLKDRYFYLITRQCSDPWSQLLAFTMCHVEHQLRCNVLFSNYYQASGWREHVLPTPDVPFRVDEHPLILPSLLLSHWLWTQAVKTRMLFMTLPHILTPKLLIIFHILFSLRLCGLGFYLCNIYLRKQPLNYSDSLSPHPFGEQGMY